MLDRVLFWVVLAWMVALLVLAFLAVREVWRETSKPDAEGDQPSTTPPAPPKADAASGKSRAPDAFPQSARQDPFAPSPGTPTSRSVSHDHLPPRQAG
jgi:cytoskeletal protein RodZ